MVGGNGFSGAPGMCGSSRFLVTQPFQIPASLLHRQHGHCALESPRASRATCQTPGTPPTLGFYSKLRCSCPRQPLPQPQSCRNHACSVSSHASLPPLLPGHGTVRLPSTPPPWVLQPHLLPVPTALCALRPHCCWGSPRMPLLHCLHTLPHVCCSHTSVLSISEPVTSEDALEAALFQ